MTQWVHKHLEAAGKAVTSRRDRTALHHLLQVLSVYPEEPNALKLAGQVLKLNMSRTHLGASVERLSRAEILDPRVDRLFCSCDEPDCTAMWISAKVGFADHEKLLVANPIGARCVQCGRYYCKRHFRQRTGNGRAMPVCPACSGNLEPAPPPNGRPSRQTVRLNKPLVHVLLFTEGPLHQMPNSLTDLFRMIAPDIFEDGPQIRGFPVGPWREDIADIAMAKLALEYPDYLTPAYEPHTAELRDAHGARLIMIKVFANRPKIVDPG
jgi:hypothetical protein